MRTDIDDALHEPQLLHARIPAVRHDRARVRDSLREVDTHVAQAIRRRQHLRPDHAAERLVARVRTAVVDMPRAHGGEDTIRIQRNLGVEVGAFVAMTRGEHVLRANLRPLHAPAVAFLRRERGQRHIDVVPDLVAETAADVVRADSNTLGRHAQTRSKQLLGKARETSCCTGIRSCPDVSIRRYTRCSRAACSSSDENASCRC